MRQQLRGPSQVEAIPQLRIFFSKGLGDRPLGFSWYCILLLFFDERSFQVRAVYSVAIILAFGLKTM